MSTVYTVSFQDENESAISINCTCSTLEMAQTTMNTILSAAVTAGGVQYPTCTFDTVLDSSGYFGFVRKNDIYTQVVRFGDVEYPENPLSNSFQTVFKKVVITPTSMS